jgi:hypothetical protein
MKLVLKGHEMENLELVSLVKELFTPGQVWRAEDLGWRANWAPQEVERQLKKIRNKELGGIVIYRIANLKGPNSWFYRF